MVWTAPEPGNYPYDVAAAVEGFRTNDPDLYELIAEIGEYRLELRDAMTPFEALVRSIVYQQLSGYAADSILKRVLSLYGDDFPTPQAVLKTQDETLRSCGLSRAKTLAVKDLAEKQAGGELPEPSQIESASDQELIEAYTIVRGIGPWTVEMLLIFNLGRSDVLPVTDLGVRRGFMVAFGGNDLPSAKELASHGERWRPYRSIASWYLWRAADPKFRAS